MTYYGIMKTLSLLFGLLCDMCWWFVAVPLFVCLCSYGGATGVLLAYQRSLMKWGKHVQRSEAEEAA